MGVAAISSERVRLFDWRLGKVEQLHDWEMSYFADQWRERKAQRPPDPARGQAVSASGRDQFDQRMEANRERFNKRTGELSRNEAGKRSWRQVLAFGDERYVREFDEGFGNAGALRHAGNADLISEPLGGIEEGRGPARRPEP
jgi:Bacterial archaeo-eukaryotic release factor family 5